jgi:hypothetical protein
MQPSKRRKVDPVPYVHSSNSALTVKLSSRLKAMLEEKPIPFVQILDIDSLLKNPEKVEVGIANQKPRKIRGRENQLKARKSRVRDNQSEAKEGRDMESRECCIYCRYQAINAIL